MIGRPLTPLPSLDPGLDSIGRPLTPCLASKAWEAGRHLVSSNPANHQAFVLSCGQWSLGQLGPREKSALLPLKYTKIGVPSPPLEYFQSLFPFHIIAHHFLELTEKAF